MNLLTRKIKHSFRFFNFLIISVIILPISCEKKGVEPEPISSDHSQGQWQLTGLEHETITAIAIHPINQEIIYAGSQFDFSAGWQGKLFKTTNSGKTWDTLLVGGSYRAILLDPSNPDIVYALPGSIMKSLDGGSTWKVVTNGIKLSWETRVQCIAIDPQNPNILYAGTGGFFGGTLFKSMDGGQSWQDILEGELDGDGVVSLSINSIDTKIIYAGTAWRGLLLKSTDAGKNWARTGLGETGQIIDVVTLSSSNIDVVFAGVRFEGLYISKDGGVTWEKEGLPDSVKNCTDLVFDPSNQSNIYAATGYGCYNKKGVNSPWIEMNEGFVYKSINVLKLSSNYNLYAGKSTFWEEGGGIYVRRIR
jgi:photosystem II stability/assembly factor-like uncharacterized protein